MSWPGKITKIVEIVKVWFLVSSPAKDPTLSIRKCCYSFVCFFNDPRIQVLSVFVFLNLLLSNIYTRSLFVSSSLDHYVPMGCFPLQRLKTLIFLWSGIFKWFFNETHVYWRSFLFVIFLQLWGSDFAHVHGIPASVTVQRTNSEEYTKVEHVISGFTSLKFLSVIILTKLFFCFTFS